MIPPKVFHPKPTLSNTFEENLAKLPTTVRSVAESLALRNPDSAKRYVEQYLSARKIH